MQIFMVKCLLTVTPIFLTGVICRHPSFVPYLDKYLTAKAVDQYMSHVFVDNTGNIQERVIRYKVNHDNIISIMVPILIIFFELKFVFCFNKYFPKQ